MRISQEKLDRFIQGLPKFKCTVCGSEGQHLVSTEAHALVNYERDGSFSSGLTPLVDVTCEKCGHVVFFSVLKLDLH
ncbi:MAG TPA: hypothetical protein VGK73_38755 [Polyangiaceae bacterium]